jgi:Protein of unknown function (DUF2612)
MTVQSITDHQARGAALLTEQFKHRPLITLLLKSWLAEVQQLEDAAHDLQLQRALDSATGVHLDILGALVGQVRGGRSDAVYRIWIAARALVNRSSGTTSQLLAIASKLCGDPVRLEEQYPGWFTLHAEQPVGGGAGSEAAQLLRIAKAAGTEMHFRWHDTASEFRFSASAASEMGSPHGFTVSQLSAVSDGSKTYAPYVPPAHDPGALLVVL